MDRNSIYHGNCVDILKEFPKNSVDLVVTSPPYDNLREYNGYDLEFEAIAESLYRVVKKGGAVIWVVADSTNNYTESGTSFNQALYFKSIGFKLYDTMIYAKKNYVPLTHRRYEQAFEYMFVFSKGRPNTFNPIMIPCKYHGSKKSRRKAKSLEDTYSVRARDEITEVKKYKQHSNIFYYQVGTNDRTEHTAPFPEELVRDQIKTWTNPGDLVLDPMCGSGTTCKVAKMLGRDYIGIDISDEYCEASRKRLELI